MFQTGPIDGVVFKALNRYRDPRGWLVELYRHDELAAGDRPVMGYVSETLPGVARGPHEHVDQSDYFAFLGPGDFKLYLWDAREASATFRHRQTAVVGESNCQAVLIPPGVVHAYKNVGERPGWVINCPNRLYAGEGRQQPVDEIRHEDQVDTLYVLD
ncbi:MAG TPA: dTDP-4-dehydrorhamnose 3,5-epimerase family protein [Pirellulales bacterium]|nr:dTDP-4-dehydrorhamnose 3,5-epimerase family protein [Pirellulales bacterium]